MPKPLSLLVFSARWLLIYLVRNHLDQSRVSCSQFLPTGLETETTPRRPSLCCVQRVVSPVCYVSPPVWKDTVESHALPVWKIMRLPYGGQVPVSSFLSRHVILLPYGGTRFSSAWAYSSRVKDHAHAFSVWKSMIASVSWSLRMRDHSPPVWGDTSFPHEGAWCLIKTR